MSVTFIRGIIPIWCVTSPVSRSMRLSVATNHSTRHTSSVQPSRASAASHSHHTRREDSPSAGCRANESHPHSASTASAVSAGSRSLAQCHRAASTTRSPGSTYRRSSRCVMTMRVASSVVTSPSRPHVAGACVSSRGQDARLLKNWANPANAA